MDKSKKSNSSNNNENNIEKQIFSMLENVLREDSDESIESEQRVQESKIKNQTNKNKLNLNFQKKEKKLFLEEKLDNMHPNPNKMLNINFNKNTEINNHLNTQRPNNQPQIFINNIPVSKDIDPNENREFNFRQNNNISPQNFCKQISQFNNLSPISKQYKNQSPTNNKEENIIRNVQLPITNRLTVAHIGMNMGYNNIVVNNSPKINSKAHTFVRNNTINHSMTKLCLNNNENNSSTCTTNSNLSNLNFSNDQIQNRSRDHDYQNFNLNGSNSSSRNEKNFEIDEIIENKIKSDDRIEMETFEKLRHKFFKIVTSQNGSRIMQTYIFNSSNEVIKAIFTELADFINEIITNIYGNYFCQKFFCVLDNEDREIFLKKITENVLENSKSKVGTYPLQAIIENIKTDEEKRILFDSLTNKIMELSLDSQAAHVIEKILNDFVDEEIVFIYEDILENFMLLANHMKGLCVVKKALQQVKLPELFDKFEKIIADNALALVHNPYGNYAIQTAFESWSEERFLPILNKFVGKFYVLSMQKYSSNVVEKCLEKGNEYMLTKFVEDICTFSRALDLMKSSYGNYVMQKALKVSSGDNKNKLTESIINNIDKLNDKKLVFKWKQIACEASGRNLSFPCIENFGNYSQNVSPNTSFNSINSNRSNNSRNSTNNNINNRNSNGNSIILNIHNQNNNNNNMIFNNTIQNNINNINNKNYGVNPMCNLNNNQNTNINTGMNYYYMPKNFSRSYNNSPVNMKMDMFPNYCNFNNQGLVFQNPNVNMNQISQNFNLRNYSDNYNDD